MRVELHSAERSITANSRKRKGRHWKTEELNDVLLDAVRETLVEIFKKEGTRVICDFMDRQPHFNREELVDKSEEFSSAFKRLLGSAAPVIEKSILRNLYGKLDLDFVERENYEFADYVKELRSDAVVER